MPPLFGSSNANYLYPGHGRRIIRDYIMCGSVGYMHQSNSDILSWKGRHYQLGVNTLSQKIHAEGKSIIEIQHELKSLIATAQSQYQHFVLSFICVTTASCSKSYLHGCFEGKSGRQKPSTKARRLSSAGTCVQASDIFLCTWDILDAIMKPDTLFPQQLLHP